MLVDTQSDITIIKSSALIQNLLFNNGNIVSMRGITNERQLSLGSTNINFIFQHLSLEHKIHEVSDDFPMLSHGILGKDFIKRFHCLIDYGDMSFTIRPNSLPSAKTTILTEISKETTVVPPNSETFKLFTINSDIFPCAIQNQEIDLNVFVPTTIAQSRECWIRVLNTTNDFKYLKRDNLKVSNTNDFSMNIHKTSERVKEMKNCVKF